MVVTVAAARNTLNSASDY